MKTLTRSLVFGCSMMALAACGADEISSPGTGGNIIINNPAPTPTVTATPTSTLVTPAGGCPTITNVLDPARDPGQTVAGLTDEGTISGETGEYRVCALPSRFNADVTLRAIDGLLYRMPGRVDIGSDGGVSPDSGSTSPDGVTDTDVTLTIEPGVIVYASGSAFLNANRGNQLEAVGTAARPIIFTSRDNVLGGSFININSSGQWGGVVLSGRAQVTDCIAPTATPGTIGCQRQVEGAVDPALFGGNTNNDDSGDLNYVQIRYSGFVLSGNSELQALTTGGTGTGTTFNNIMSYNSSDDGVEFFGGFVNMKNLVVVGAEDDSIDSDTGVQANLQYVVVAQRTNAGDAILEVDSSNAFNDSAPRQLTQISNATFIHRRPSDQVLRFRGGTDYSLVNSVVVDASGVSGGTPCIRIDDTETNRAAQAATATVAEDDGPILFRSVAFDCPDLARNGSNGGATEAQAEALVTGGAGNSATFTNTLTMTYINGTNEDGVAVFDPTALSSFFDVPTFIGAANAASTRFAGWTCNSATLTFDGANTGSCLSLPPIV